MFVGVVALRYQHQCCVVLITECYNSHKQSQSPLTRCIDVCNIERAHIFLHLKVKILIQNLSFTDCVLTLYMEGRPHLR